MAENWLFFIDTNILLDFYRLRGDTAIRYLDALEKHKNSLITSEQVRMEYLKHRQRVVLETVKELRKPTNQKLPPILSEYQPAQMMKSHIEAAEKSYSKVKVKTDGIISEPSKHDNVYKSLNRIFKVNSRYNLTRATKDRFLVRNLARKRFSLGYPPRKGGDTSIGDAYNWEWIVHCANSCPNGSHILIVSRDGDFGSTIGQDSYLNDWLRQEFKDRVSRKRKIELTSRLAVALKRMDETVTEEDQKAEEFLLGTPSSKTYTDLWNALNANSAASILSSTRYETLSGLLAKHALTDDEDDDVPDPE